MIKQIVIAFLVGVGIGVGATHLTYVTVVREDYMARCVLKLAGKKESSLVLGDRLVSARQAREWCRQALVRR